MATAAGKAVNDDLKTDAQNIAALEAEIAALKAELEALARQFARAGEHGMGTAKRAAALGVEQLRSQGEAALDNVRSSAKDVEAQLIAQVQEKPVTSLAIAAGVGYLFALLSRR
jgi:ElaB/YqjD/DUF883 family membrane-anchored ribosome-binding protein